MRWKRHDKSEGYVQHGFFSRLGVRIFIYFASVLSLFAVLIGVIYMNLYEKNTMETYRTDLEEQAERISSQMLTFQIKEDKNGFKAYKEALASIENSDNKDIWIVSNLEGTHQLASEFTNVDISKTELTDEIWEVLQDAFGGENASNQGYDSIYECSVVRVAVPIYDAKGYVSGAVMIISLVQSQRKIIRASESMIIVSLFVGLLVALVISILFARQLARPVNNMKDVAMKLAEGDYQTKTEVKMAGEIGDLASSLDVLSVKLAENEQERKNMEKMRMDFFANVSHELRTPITVMRGYTESLVDWVITGEEKRQKYYQRMLLECQSMQRLVGDLLLLSKMQNPDFQLEKEPVSLAQILEDLLRSGSQLAAKKNLHIYFIQDGQEHFKDTEDYLMMGDYDRLRQMFLVILDNAVKFSNEGGSITITLDHSSEKLFVSIQDEGIGILEEELPFIFEKFYKSKLRQNAKGSGLGLMIAREIAEKHGGEITVESQQNKGTTFYFSFDKIDPKVL